jgi:WD40 repeat protein
MGKDSKFKEIALEHAIIKICLEKEKENPVLGIIQASRILFVSYKDFQLKGKIKGKEDFFLNGDFGKKSGKIFAVSGKNQQIDLFNFLKKSLLRNLKGHSAPVYSVNFSSDGLTLISGGNDMLFKFWDISLQKCILSSSSHNHYIRSVSFFPKSNQVCGSGSYDGKIKVHDLRVKEPVVCFFDHGCPVENFRFLPDQKTMVSVGGNYLKLWNVIENKCVFQVRYPRPLINLSVFSERSILYNPMGQEINLLNSSTLTTYPLFCFEKEILSMETSWEGILVGFSNGKVCYKNMVLNLKSCLNQNHRNLSSFSHLSRPQRLQPFLGTRKGNKHFFPKIIEIKQNKRIFTRPKKKSKDFFRAPNLLESISWVVQESYEGGFLLPKASQINVFFKQKISIFTKSSNFLEVLPLIKLETILILTRLIISKISFNFSNQVLLFLRKMFRIDLLFSKFQRKGFSQEILSILLQKKKDYEKKLIFQSLKKQSLREEV